MIRIGSAMPTGIWRDFKWAGSSPICMGVKEKREDDGITYNDV
jgi:hypothetical protein